MPIKTSTPLSYTSYYVEKRKTKRVFLKQIAQLINWDSLTHILEKYYPTGQSVKPGVDQEARWVKKGGKLQYGYKRHYLTDAQEGLVMVVHTTAANAHESQHLEACLNKTHLPPGSRVLADKGYCAQANEAMLRSRGLRSGIQRKAARNKPLTSREKRYNKLVGKVRYKIERVFGSIKRWFGGLKARYVGLMKTHGQHVLEALAYNLYRLPGLIMSNA